MAPCAGFLGLGTMGAPMAARLLENTDGLVVWNRTPAAMDSLLASGAVGAASISEALAQPASFSMLANDAAALDVLSEENLAGTAGRVHVSMSSLSPAATAELAARATRAGVSFVACPVLGRPPLAASGQLNILAAGNAEAIASVAPLLDLMGKRVWLLGDDPRTAVVVKIAINYNIIHAIQAIGESMALVEAHGVSPATFAELLSGTLFGGIAYTGYSDTIANRRYSPPAFSMALGHKDLRLAKSLAEDAGFALPTARVLDGLFIEALDDPELAHDDWAALAEITRRTAASAAVHADRHHEGV